MCVAVSSAAVAQQMAAANANIKYPFYLLQIPVVCWATSVTF
jgi:hypothetical protein